jgi:hypothetical protein
MQAQAQDDQACQISGTSPGTQAYSECRRGWPNNALLLKRRLRRSNEIST